MKSSSSPAPPLHQHYSLHRTEYTEAWSNEEKSEGWERQEDDSQRNTRKYHTESVSAEEEEDVPPASGRGSTAFSDNGINRSDSFEERQRRQEAEYLQERDSDSIMGSSQGNGLPFSSQPSSQNHGYYSQQATPVLEEPDTQKERRHGEDEKLPPATVRRMSMSHIRLQEALSSPLRPPPLPARATAAAAPLHPNLQSEQQQRRRHSFARDVPSELSEYIHSDLPQQQTPIKPLPPPLLALPTPQPAATNPRRRTNPQSAYHPPTLQKRSSSFIRLSTSLNGHAEVVIDTEPTLPPPLPHSSSSSSELMTPRRRGAPAPSTSSILRDFDTLRSSRVWEFCCDKQQQPGTLRLHHSMLEPDEAGVALSIARRRREALKEARRKLVFDVVGGERGLLVRGDSGLGVGLDDLSRPQMPAYDDDDGPFGSGKKLMQKPRKKKVSLGNHSVGAAEVPSARITPACAHNKHFPASTSIFTSTPPSTSRKRAYREIEIYTQSSSKTYPPLPPEHHRVNNNNNGNCKKKKKPLLPPGSKPQPHSGGGGGEDYYIPGHESDKENLLAAGNAGGEVGGESAAKHVSVFGELVNGCGGGGGKVKALKKTTDKEREREKDRRRGGGSSGSGEIQMFKKKKDKNKAMVPVKKKRRTGTGTTTTGVLRDVSAAVAAKGKGVIHRLAGGGERERPQRGGSDVDVDLGGAELLLSLSAGRWGS